MVAVSDTRIVQRQGRLLVMMIRELCAIIHCPLAVRLANSRVVGQCGWVVIPFTDPTDGAGASQMPPSCDPIPRWSR
jgi:hypothetical protein